jgi:hypothetical protein
MSKQKKDEVRQTITVRAELDRRASRARYKGNEISMYQYVFTTGKHGVEGRVFVPKGNPATLERAPKVKVSVELTEKTEEKEGEEQ